MCVLPAPTARPASRTGALPRREEFNGALARVIEHAGPLAPGDARRGRGRGLKREDRHIYPLFAVREALVNRVCHRDYRLTGRSVEVKQYDDRLEISSPGGLPGYITVDNSSRSTSRRGW